MKTTKDGKLKEDEYLKYVERRKEVHEKYKNRFRNARILKELKDRCD